MSKHTTTLMEIIQSELIKSGKNEFVNENRLSFNNSDYAFIQKIMYYDKDVQYIVNDKIFKGFKFTDERIDRYFKESFVVKFMDREINRQTVEAFASQVLYVTLTREDYIYTVFGSEMQKYLEQHIESDSNDSTNSLENETQQQQRKERQRQEQNETHTDEVHANGTSTTDDRNAVSTLPQSEVNINVDNTELDYADNNTINRNKGITQDDTDSSGERDTNSDSITNGEDDSKRKNTQESTAKHNSLTKSYFIDNIEKLYNMRDRLYNEYDKKCFLQIW